MHICTTPEAARLVYQTQPARYASLYHAVPMQGRMPRTLSQPSRGHSLHRLIKVRPSNRAGAEPLDASLSLLNGPYIKHHAHVLFSSTPASPTAPQPSSQTSPSQTAPQAPSATASAPDYND